MRSHREPMKIRRLILEQPPRAASPIAGSIHPGPVQYY
jgi:hypothetical protein